MAKELEQKPPVPAPAPVKKGSSLEDDDLFEDFPASAEVETDAELKALSLWEDTWEDVEECVDFSVQLAEQKALRSTAMKI
jgi:hypothetical protein